VEEGWVEIFSRPGQNFTGLTSLAGVESTTKRMSAVEAKEETFGDWEQIIQDKHALFGAVSPLARWRGYRAAYPQLSRTVLAL
jgi:hypothetical protein